MILIVVLFFEPDWPSTLLAKYRISTTHKREIKEINQTKSYFVILTITTYLLVQLWLPLRHHFIVGQVDWTGEGGMFAWRMKAAGRSGHVDHFNIYLYDKVNNKER